MMYWTEQARIAMHDALPGRAAYRRLQRNLRRNRYQIVCPGDCNAPTGTYDCRTQCPSRKEVSEVPTYFVTDGWSKGESWFVAVRRPSGSLRRVVSINLPLCTTRLQALEDLSWWLHAKAATARLADRAAYREQLARVKAEIVAEGGTPHPRDTGWPYGIEGYGADREKKARERVGT